MKDTDADVALRYAPALAFVAVTMHVVYAVAVNTAPLTAQLVPDTV